MAIVDTILDCAEAVRKIIRSARTSPDLISLPDNSLKAIVYGSFVGAVLVFLNRCLLHPETISDLSGMGLNILFAASSLIPVFLVSAFILLARVDGNADQTADRFSVLFVFVWFVALLLFFVDQVLGSPLGDFMSGLRAGKIFQFDGGFIYRFATYSVIAYCILFFRTYRTDSSKISIWATFAGFITVVFACTVLLYVFVYSIPLNTRLSAII